MRLVSRLLAGSLAFRGAELRRDKDDGGYSNQQEWASVIEVSKLTHLSLR